MFHIPPMAGEWIIIGVAPPRGQWMDHRCRLSFLGNSSTASGSFDLVGDGRPQLQLGRPDFVFRARFTSF